MAEIIRQSEGIIEFDILIEGKKIKDTIKVQEISIEMEVNRITSAVITIQDGGTIGVIPEPYTNSEGNDFIPGNKIEITLGHPSKTEKVFEGIIVSQQLKAKGETAHLTITCQHTAVHMTKGRFNGLFQNQTDSDAIKSIVSKYGLDFEMDDTSLEHPVLMQYNCSDWDYLVTRAEANDMLVNTYQNKLRVKKVDFSIAPQYSISCSEFVIDIDLKLESTNLSSAYTMSSWDSSTQEVRSCTYAIEDPLNQGNLSAKKLSKVLDHTSDSYSSAAIAADEMKVWLTSEANRASLEKIQGKITVPGNTKIVAGVIIKLSEFSARFNGNAFISKVIHRLRDGEWITELTVGKSAKPHAAFNTIEATGALGLLPSLRGTQVATVKRIHKDPDMNYRVLVTLPTLIGSGQEDGIWARMVFPYASGDAGFLFFPEVEDEVLLTFMNEDPRFPVIIGSLYSAKHKPKELADEKNQFKSISTKSGITIKFNDEDKILSIETPSANTIILDDKNKNVSIKDENENAIVMDASGITMKTPRDINLNAAGNINFTTNANLTMKAAADATLEALSITQKAQISFTAQGNASAELSAAGQTTVKGAMVMIN